jgi:hypothetical protein
MSGQTKWSLLVFSVLAVLVLLSGCATTAPIVPKTALQQCSIACRSTNLQSFEDDSLKCYCHKGK